MGVGTILSPHPTPRDKDPRGESARLRVPPPPQGTAMNFIRAIMPREDSFFDMFARHADALVAGSDVLVSMLAGKLDIAEACREIARYEHEADDIAREVLTAVRRSFITPFDRGAISKLIGSMDDAI